MTKWQLRQREIAPKVIKNVPDEHKRYQPVSISLLRLGRIADLVELLGL
jgi:hypothetical protein